MTAGRSVVEIVVLMAAALTAFGVIARFTTRWGRMTIHFFQRIEKALINVEGQLYPNGGASLRDAVNRLQAAIGVTDIPAKIRPDSAAPHRPDPQPPSTLLTRLGALETRDEAVNRTADMETQSKASGRTEVIVEAVYDAVETVKPINGS